MLTKFYAKESEFGKNEKVVLPKDELKYYHGHLLAHNSYCDLEIDFRSCKSNFV